MARVSTYLNFPGKTEEAFLFYKSIFGGEFVDELVRFGQLPPMPNTPPLSEEDKNLVLHVSLELLGGHLLMGADATESMGFKGFAGNNMHINLEPDTKEETNRLFDALSKDGNITLQLHDAFWGAYYGSCTDKFGIHWMFNCVENSNI
jgi:PhnB protein